MTSEPAFNPAYPVARCGDSATHAPHVVEHGPDQPRNCPGTGPTFAEEFAEALRAAADPGCGCWMHRDPRTQQPARLAAESTPGDSQ